jgi:hypothetical protein
LRGDAVTGKSVERQQRRRGMERKAFGFLLMGLTLAAPAFSQGRHQQAPVVNRPPVAGSQAEKRILGVLDQMVTGRELYLAIDAGTGRMLRLLAETAGAKNVVEIGTSTGYSGLWISLALQDTGGRLRTFEIDPARAEQARKHFAQAGRHCRRHLLRAPDRGRHRPAP